MPDKDNDDTYNYSIKSETYILASLLLFNLRFNLIIVVSFFVKKVISEMYTRDYYERIRHLIERYGLQDEDMIFVENIADWCRRCGILEPDKTRPFKLISQQGGRAWMLIKEDITDKIVNDRMNVLSIHGQLSNVAHDRAESLNSDEKKLTYLLLSEIAHNLYDMTDEFLADEWAFEEMGRLGFLKGVP